MVDRSRVNTPKLDTASGVVFLDAASIDLGDMEMSALKQVADPVHMYPQTTPQELPGRHPDAWCVITNKVELDRAFFEARPGLRLVCIIATGTNNVDLDAAREQGVAVCNCRGYSTDTVAQHVLMLMLAFARGFTRYESDVNAGAWSRSPFFCLLDHPIREMGSLTLGIVGFGEIGQRVSQLAEALSMQVLVAERPGRTPRPGRAPFDEVLQASHFLSLHCPLTAETQHIIDEEALRKMRPDAFLINTARGGLVNEAALLHALTDGWIAGAAVDVLNSEPPPPDYPLMQAKLPNLIVTPHCAWGSVEARQRAINQTAENITHWLAGGEMRRVV